MEVKRGNKSKELRPRETTREISTLKEIARAIEKQFVHIRLCTTNITEHGIKIRWALENTTYWFFTEIYLSNLIKMGKRKLYESEVMKMNCMLADWITEKRSENDGTNT